MMKTQVHLPDELYHAAQAIAEPREWSPAEVVRRGIELMTVLHPIQPPKSVWKLPVLESEAFREDFDQLDFKSLAENAELGHSLS
ncbi:MAG: hypothetical protein ACKV19_24485 [Verrucomicrobiales bacterium]